MKRLPIGLEFVRPSGRLELRVAIPLMLYSNALLKGTIILSSATSSALLRRSQVYLSRSAPLTRVCVKHIRGRIKASTDDAEPLQTAATEDALSCIGSESDCYLMADDMTAELSFRKALQNSAPPIIPDDLAGIQLTGIQQFAAAIWDRQKNIPAWGQKPPLERIFDAFDADRDGHLTPGEVAAALSSRGVDLSEAVARKFVEASDANNNETVEKDEFGTLIILMASADLRKRQDSQMHEEPMPECEGDECEIEWDDDGEVRFPTAPHCQPSNN